MTNQAASGAKRRSSVTALVPAYKAGGFIQATLDSLSAQTWPEFEILISVDLGDDDTLAICRAHAGKDPRFKVFEQAQRLGWIGNSNFLLEQARGDYALFAFHDDLLHPGCIEKLANALDGDPQAVLAFPDLSLSRLDGASELCAYSALDGMQDRVERARRLLARERHWWVPVHGLFRLDRARNIGGLKHHGAGEFSADWPWLVHMSLLGSFRHVPEVLCTKLYKPDSLSPNWQFSRDNRKDAAASCMREIWNSELATAEKLALSRPLLESMMPARRNLKAQIEKIGKLLGRYRKRQ